MFIYQRVFKKKNSPTWNTKKHQKAALENERLRHLGNLGVPRQSW
jgi:hypothetical protein